MRGGWGSARGRRARPGRGEACWSDGGRGGGSRAGAGGPLGTRVFQSPAAAAVRPRWEAERWSGPSLRAASARPRCRARLASRTFCGARRWAQQQPGGRIELLLRRCGRLCAQRQLFQIFLCAPRKGANFGLFSAGTSLRRLI